MVAHMRIEVLSLLAYRTQNLVLIWDTVTSYGLTPFRSDFVDYVKCDIPVRDVTKVNTVAGITYPRQMFVCSLLKRTTRCMVDTQKSIAIAYACY
jgi:hypothetical protein